MKNGLSKLQMQVSIFIAKNLLQPSFESAKKMIENSKQNNVRIMEGFMFRFHPQHQKVKDLINNNKIGDLVSFNGTFGFPAFPEGDIRYNKKLGGWVSKRLWVLPNLR